MRPVGFAVLITLAACSGEAPGPAPVPIPSTVVVGRVVADDPHFDAAAANAPRFVACRGLSGCARSSPGGGERYPGAAIPAEADAAVDHTIEFVLYLVGARFEQADLAGDTLHVAVTERVGGLQMVKLDGRRVFAASGGVGIAVEARGRVICRMGAEWEGCG